MHRRWSLVRTCHDFAPAPLGHQARAQSVGEGCRAANPAHRGRLLREAGGMAAHGLRILLDQACPTAVLLKQAQAQHAQPIGKPNVDLVPHPGRAQVDAVRAVFRSQTLNEPADTVAGLKQGDFKACIFQQVRRQ